MFDWILSIRNMGGKEQMEAYSLHPLHTYIYFVNVQCFQNNSIAAVLLLVLDGLVAGTVNLNTKKYINTRLS
jgi:hypothetical protein